MSKGSYTSGDRGCTLFKAVVCVFCCVAKIFKVCVCNWNWGKFNSESSMWNVTRVRYYHNINFARYLTTPPPPLSLSLSLSLSLRTCTNPSADLFPSWDFDDLLTWPICRDDPQLNPDRSDHRTCELVGRPCCHGIQGNCNITTREHCDFLQGRFHQDAFLCSQVKWCQYELCNDNTFTSTNNNH